MNQESAPLVAVVLGSDSDLPQMEPCCAHLELLGIGYDLIVASAHRTPDVVHELATSARERGYVAIIAAAGGAAHLAGVIAAATTLPVIGVPMKSAALSGVDSLYSMVQMPAGTPVATVAIGEAGAANAAILVGQILGISQPRFAERIADLRAKQRERVMQRNVQSGRSRRFGSGAGA